MSLVRVLLHCSATSPSQFPATTQRQPRHKHQSSDTVSFPTYAHQVLDDLPLRDTFAWNALIRSHIAEGDPGRAILVYRQMLLRGACADKHTLPHLITASRLAGNAFYGKQVHCHALKLGLGGDDYVVTALMEMYGQLDGAGGALKVFKQSVRNSVSWTLLAKLYSMEDQPLLALQVFDQMVESKVEVDSVALVTALRACMQLKSIQEGRKVHETAKQSGLESDVLVGNMLLKMYIECEGIEESRDFFDQMPKKDAASWTTIINGYVQSGGFNEALKLFRLMSVDGQRPDSFSVSAVLPSCARMAAHKHGKEIHAHIIRNQIEMNSTVQNALMDMYVKSGNIDAASKIFERMQHKDAISYTVMILGYSLHGQGEVGVALFHEMEKQAKDLIDEMTYTAVLFACNSACLVDEGKHFFERLNRPQTEHYALIVSLLSRAGCFDEVRAFVRDHEIGWHADIQRAMLSGCRVHRNLKLGKPIVEKLMELEPLNAENYVMLSNLYAASNKWGKVKVLRETILDMGLTPRKAYSWIELKGKIHVFGVGDVSHPRLKRIYWELDCLMKKMEAKGYVPENDFSLHDVDEERECTPCGHSEMLAIAFGLISTKRTVVRVTKGITVCRCCHASAKMISELVEREIILRDPHRFHHFKDGFCSCRDAW